MRWFFMRFFFEKDYWYVLKFLGECLLIEIEMECSYISEKK